VCVCVCVCVIDKSIHMSFPGYCRLLPTVMLHSYCVDSQGL